MQQAWDKNGRIYYIDDNGNRVQPKSTKNAFERLGMQAKAGLGNLNRWLQNADTNSQSYKDKVNVALGLLTAPIGGSSALAAKGAGALTPFFGKKIAQSVASNAVGGATGGAVEGFGRGLVEQKNPIKTAVQDGTIGLVTGALGGVASGKIGQVLDRRALGNNILAPEQYFADYVEGLSNNSPLGQVSRFDKGLADFRLAKEGTVKGGNSKEFLFAGENALNADINALTEAESMYLDENAKNLDIWKKTGWFKGVDGNWRFEIPNGKLIDDINWHTEIDKNNKPFQSAKLYEVYDNPTFYEAYPEAKDLDVYLSDLGDKAGSYHELGKYIDLDKPSNYRTVDPKKLKQLEEIKQDPLYKKAHDFRSDKSFEDIKNDYMEYKNSDLYKREDDLLQNLTIDGWNKEGLNSLQHELQHFIQGQENFARGGNPKSAGGIKNYNRLAGEVEARLAENRGLLTPEQMKEHIPFVVGDYGYDVAPTKQLLDKGYGVYGKGEVYKVPKNNLYDKLIDNSVNLQKPIPKGHMRLYRGLQEEFNPNYDKSKLDNVNGYESWTDNYDLAKAYGDNVYYIDLPESTITRSIIDENHKSMTYGDRNLIYEHDKPVGIKGKNGKEYMLYTYHENYPEIKYNKFNQ